MKSDLDMIRINLERDLERKMEKHSIIINTDVISKLTDMELRELIDNNSSLNPNELVLKGVLTDIIFKMKLKTEISLIID